MVEVTSPENFFGYQMGEAKKLARWDELVNYYYKLAQESPRVKTLEMGRSTEDNPLLLVIITSPENHQNLKEIQKVGPTLAYRENLPEEELEELIRRGKAVISMGMSIHASEVGGTQMAPELAYQLASGDDPDTLRILEETVLLLVPCVNPDGNIIVVNWYKEWLGTEYEGCGLPWLYHKYTGHDNNRDLVLMNIPESRHMAQMLFKDWFPLAYIDYHHYGSFGGRYYIPPFANPTDPNVDPILWAEMQLYGSAMLANLEQQGKTGVENYAGFTAEFNSAYTRACTWHGITGMLTESASAKLATPKYIHYHQLNSTRGRPEYRAHVNFPHPWKGGWWTLRDIVEQQKISALAALDMAAKYRELLLRNLRLKAVRAQAEKTPYALIFHPEQHDPLTAYKLLEALNGTGIKILRAEEDFSAEGIRYKKGTFIVPYTQISRAYLMSTMRRRLYHDNPWARSPEGTPLDLQDIAGYNLTELMGINVKEANNPFKVRSSEVTSLDYPKFTVRKSEQGYIIDCSINDSYKAINSLLKDGYTVNRFIEEVIEDKFWLPPGAFWIPEQEGVKDKIQELSDRFHIPVLPGIEGLEHVELRGKKIAIYQRYWGGNMDEGWTRFLMDEYGFDYTVLKDEEVKDGLDNYETLLIPSDPNAIITGEKLEEYFEERYKGRYTLPKYPPDYRSGLGEEGVEKIREFVENGGTLILLNEAVEFAIKSLDIPVNNVLENKGKEEFFCPGSTLRAEIDLSHPLAYGIADETRLLHWRSPALEIKPVEDNEDYHVIARYHDENILESGWLIGEQHLSRKAAAIEAKMKKGRVVMYGFWTQFRAQTHATFKFLFNALL
jgi:hypothetical protein